MKKETVGKVAIDLQGKVPDTRDPIELERELHTDYEKNIYECLERGKRECLGDFFIVTITKKEPLLENVLRHYFFYRLSCPTPDYDQTVYRYTRSSDTIDFLWVIPSRETCMTLMENRSRVSPAEYGLLDYVVKFSDGTLYKRAKKLNGEVEDSVLLQTS